MVCRGSGTLLRRKETQRLLKAIAFREFDQSLLSPYLFSIAFKRLKKGKVDFCFGVFMVAS
jgi:hypothetical protein